MIPVPNVPQHSLHDDSRRGPWQPTPGQNHVKASDLLVNLPRELDDGVHTLTVTRIEGRGQSIKMHVEDATGAIAEVTIGSPGKARDTRLRILTGTSDLDDFEELRQALEGEKIRVKLTTYEIQGTIYRGVERAG